jgi:mRNA-degrading endonuclease RelE of RelBE toxin-antitoxin system
VYVDISPNAASDIRILKAENAAAAAAVLATLEQIANDPNALDKLTTQDNVKVGSIHLNVKKWNEMQRMVGNLWRLRILDTPATSYRVIYGYHWQTKQLYILAVVHKELLDYDDRATEINRRITADWRSL